MWQTMDDINRLYKGTATIQGILLSKYFTKNI